MSKKMPETILIVYKTEQVYFLYIYSHSTPFFQIIDL